MENWDPRYFNGQNYIFFSQFILLCISLHRNTINELRKLRLMLSEQQFSHKKSALQLPLLVIGSIVPKLGGMSSEWGAKECFLELNKVPVFGFFHKYLLILKNRIVMSWITEKWENLILWMLAFFLNALREIWLIVFAF